MGEAGTTKHTNDTKKIQTDLGSGRQKLQNSFDGMDLAIPFPLDFVNAFIFVCFVYFVVKSIVWWSARCLSL